MTTSTVYIASAGERLEADHVRAESDALTGPNGRPLVVMAHGFGACRDGGLMPFAQRFAAAGMDSLIFDYRSFGGSTGTPRQNLNHLRHREDYHAALAHARGLAGIDPDRVAVWGSSYSGGHVIAVAAQDHRVAAVVAQGAAMDGLSAVAQILRYAGFFQLVRLTGHSLLDLAGTALHCKPHLVPIVGPEHTVAPITAPGSLRGFTTIMGPTFRNEMLARGILLVMVNRPVNLARRVSAPVLLVAANRDNIAPTAAVRAVATRLGDRAELLPLECGHFDIYRGGEFEESVAAQIQFLRKRLAPARL